MKKLFNILITVSMPISLSSCTIAKKETSANISNYTGIGSITQGFATTNVKTLYPKGKRDSGIGTIKSTDGLKWTVPSEVNFTNDNFPTAPDLYNKDGIKHSSADKALNAFDPSKVIQIDSDGETITAYIFSDNYFEMYVNGVPVGKDAVPFTDFNSHILKFKVKRPFTIAMKLVDWEENLGLGSENNRGKAYHPGDGGMVAVFKNERNNTIANTGSDWKAKTFYIAPLHDLSCVVEKNGKRNSSACISPSVDNGSKLYGLHWKVPINWMAPDFNDSKWSPASTYTNSIIGVNNKVSYTNFKNIFDEELNDAKFIWSNNVVLDNEVLVRLTVK